MPKETTGIKRVIDGVQASMAVEGLIASKKAQVIGRKYLKGKLTSKEAVSLITTHHANKTGDDPGAENVRQSRFAPRELGPYRGTEA